MSIINEQGPLLRETLTIRVIAPDGTVKSEEEIVTYDREKILLAARKLIELAETGPPEMETR